MLRDARLIAVKDLRIEWSSKILTGQVLPFGLLVLILFGFGISPERMVKGKDNLSVLEDVSPALFWLAVLFSTLLALGRSFAIEAADGNLDALALAGLDPAGIFLGKTAAVVVELAVLELVVGSGALLLYGASIKHPLLLMVVVAATTLALAGAGILYAALGAGLRVRDTLVPLLVLPVLAPVLLGATRATEAALSGSAADGWPWAGFLGAFSLLYLGAGILLFGSLLEES